MIVVDILAPIILLVALGTVLRVSGFASEAFFRETNRLLFWVALPSLLFVKIATAAPQLGRAAGIVAVLLIGMAACVAVGYLVAWGLKLPRPAAASFVQGGYRSNLAYVGLPLVLYALAVVGGDTPEAEALALLAIAPLIPVYNIAAVLILTGAQRQEQADRGEQAWRLLQSVISNPLVIACVAGLAFAYSGLALPAAIERTLDALGQMALPLSLLGLGATLRAWALRSGGVPALISALIKVLFAPLVGYGVARLLGLSAPEQMMAMLYLAMPTAVLSYVMAERMGADGRLAGSIVVLSTLLAMPSLAVILLLTTS